MSVEARPISNEAFAMAIQDLPIENVYNKAHELENSITHLERSNSALQEYSDSIRNDTSIPGGTREEGDKDCLEAIQENQVVIERQKQRIDLLKQEVERRGARWHEKDPRENGTVNGHADGTGQVEGIAQPTTTDTSSTRLTDDELRRRMEERMNEQQDDDDDEGMHL